jgi:hypothetical protein
MRHKATCPLVPLNAPPAACPHDVKRILNTLLPIEVGDNGLLAPARATCEENSIAIVVHNNLHTQYYKPKRFGCKELYLTYFQ